MELTSKQRSYLIGLSNELQPILQIGKARLTPENTEAVNECFHNNELIKIAVLKNCDDSAQAIAEAVAGRTHSTVVKVIGKKIILYKPNKDKPKIELPK